MYRASIYISDQTKIDKQVISQSLECQCLVLRLHEMFSRETHFGGIKHVSNTDWCIFLWITSSHYNSIKQLSSGDQLKNQVNLCRGFKYLLQPDLYRESSHGLLVRIHNFQATSGWFKSQKSQSWWPEEQLNLNCSWANETMSPCQTWDNLYDPVQGLIIWGITGSGKAYR